MVLTTTKAGFVSVYEKLSVAPGVYVHERCRVRMYTVFEGLQSQVPCCLTEPAARGLERRNPPSEIIHGLRPARENIGGKLGIP